MSLFFILLAIVTLLTALILYISDRKSSYPMPGMAIGCGLLTGCLIGAAVLLSIAGWRGRNVPTRQEATTNIPIVSLHDDSGSHGNFLYFTSDGYYTYYYRTGEHQFAQGRVRAQGATIKESSTESPHIEETHFDGEFWNGPMSYALNDDGDSYTFVVPPNSVVREFQLNGN